MASIDLNAAAVFVRVVEAGSFTAAADALRMPKSSVSRRITALEAFLGVRLLQRTTRRIRMTDAGQRYFRGASDALARLDAATAELSDARREPRGTVRMTVADFGGLPIPEVLGAFLARHPLVHVDLTVTSRRVHLVEEGFDLAIRAGFLEDSTLVARRVATSELRLYAAPAYLRRQPAPRRLEDLARHDCVLYRSATRLFPWRLTGPRGVQTARPKGAFTVDDLGFAHRMVVAGGGVGLLPAEIAEPDVARRALVRVLPAHAVKGGAIYVVSPPLRHMPAHVAALREHLIAELPRALRASIGAT